jgi:hypothetical protein
LTRLVIPAGRTIQVRDAATAGFLQSRISKGYRPAAAGRRGCGEGEAMALTLHVCPEDNGAVVWASGDVDTNVAETFQDMMLSVMRRAGS